MPPIVSRIRIYPIKSLDPVELSEAEIGVNSLLHDREFALLHENRFVNGKRTGRVNELKASYDFKEYTVALSERKNHVDSSFHLLHDQSSLENYLTDFFKLPILLHRNTSGELMDIPGESGITLVSEASLKSLQSDMPSHSLEDLILRFRPNIVIEGADAFWEEQLFGKPGVGVEFSIGDVNLIGMSPRARCNVPPRDPFTGIPDKSFMKTMMKSREQSLPRGSNLLGYGGLYQLSVNTYIPETEKGKIIRLGDPLKINGPITLQRL